MWHSFEYVSVFVPYTNLYVPDQFKDSEFILLKLKLFSIIVNV